MTPAIEARAALAPCPFCGSSEVSESIGQTGNGDDWHYIECEACGASAEPDYWNRRSPSVAERVANSVSDERLAELIQGHANKENWGYSVDTAEALRELQERRREAAVVTEPGLGDALAELQLVWEEIDSSIVRGDLSGNGWDKTAERNGLVLASNLVMQRIALLRLHAAKLRGER